MGRANNQIYDAASDMNRAQLQAGLLQQGYGQGIAGAQNAFNQQSQLAQTVPGMYQSRYCELWVKWAQHNRLKHKQVLMLGRETKRMAA